LLQKKQIIAVIAIQGSSPMKTAFFTRRRIIVGAIALSAIAAGVIAMKRPAAPPALLTSPVEVADIEDTVLASGTIEAFKQVNVGAQVSGQIKAIHVQLGQKISKGQLIAEIDSLTQQNNLQTAEASLRNVEAQKAAKLATLAQAELTFARQKELLAADAGSKESFESAEASLKSAQADVAALNAQITSSRISVNTAQVNLGYTRIVAPMDGYVVSIPVKEGQTVNSAQSTPTIVKMARLDMVTVKAEISEADVPKVKPGLKTYFTILGEPEKRYFTTLRAVEPMPSTEDDSTSTSTTTTTSTSSAIYYNGLLDAPNPEGKLRISMTAQVNIVLAHAEKTLLIPATALEHKLPDGRWMVMIAGEDGRPKPRKISVGINNRIKAQVLDGLREGERVVTGQSTGQTETSQRQQRRMGPPPM
jgi:macrolide-specific efflux system membrane fusion protein